jgi:MFS family permease
VLHGVYLVWLVQERGFAPALVATMLAAGDLCVFALEVPTGWLADRLGHRISLIVGSALQVLGMLAFWQAATPAGLLTASLLVAAADAFRSGADQALLYRSCAALGREREFQSIHARTEAVTQVALVVMLVAGGVIVSVAGYPAAFATEVACCLVGFVLACLMTEPPGTDGELDHDDVETSRSVVAGPRAWAVAWLIVPAAVLDGVAGAAAFLAQTRDDASVAGVTGLVAAITLGEAAGAWLAARAWQSDGRHLGLLAFGAAAVAVPLFFLAGAPVTAVALAVVLGLISPLRAAALQRAASDGARARIASLASACDMACTTLGLLAAGAWSARRRSH